ncbi:hypothetical protein TVAGG3_0500430 [Trichomonas vaginalis G3]|uniref:hypothetical protein n=1 Tax=Trichomonas vaginalis (strain ATCC PRA-98 / G3) TaxID=412133 RepID=UPI0021E55740|nr:hypothetical protein TVAGG3_0500430 [Trichomonas vaginalis G3]KAI5517036.1 hypothetical protein TVAGG3_0500430 [Trichomonas vaginalis G3]
MLRIELLKSNTSPSPTPCTAAKRLFDFSNVEISKIACVQTDDGSSATKKLAGPPRHKMGSFCTSIDIEIRHEDNKIS